MAFFMDPGAMFLGCLGPSEQKFLVTLIETAAKSGYTRFVEPCAGTFAMANLAVQNGFKPEQIETSDVNMMSTVLGYAITGQSLEPLEIHAQGFSDEELLDPATALYAQLYLRTSKNAGNDYFYQILTDLRLRREEHIESINRQIEVIKNLLGGMSYRPLDMWEHLKEVLDDPHALVIANPPTYFSGYEKFYDTQGKMTWKEPPYEEAVQGAIENGIEPKEAETMPKSVTFIASTLHDNKILMKNDPGYLANLQAMALVQRERLLHGNWKIKAAAGLMFKRVKVNMLEEIPPDVIKWARGWDLAATSEDEKGDPAYTAGVLIGKRRNGRYIVADVINRRLSSSDVREIIKQTCIADRAKYGRVATRLPQDPGQAGKDQAQSFMKLLAGFTVKCIQESGDKVTRAEPFSAQWLGLEGMDKGNVDVLIAPWNEEYFNECENFPQSKFKDMVDASSSAFTELESGATYSAPPKDSQLGKSSYWNK